MKEAKQIDYSIPSMSFIYSLIIAVVRLSFVLSILFGTWSIMGKSIISITKSKYDSDVTLRQHFSRVK